MSELTAENDTALRLERHRVELTAYCYRMLGSAFEAEDAVQETMVRAWRGFDRFEGRASVRSWLYRIATNVCLDMAKSSQRRARPMDLASPSTAATPIDAGLPEATWIGPVPDGRVLDSGGDPADQAVARESVRLALIAALQRLAPRQRAVLILREVLAWKASEVAELLDTSVASVNSALQRARATLSAGAGEVPVNDPARPMDEAQRSLLARYVDAFERYDLDALTALLHEDATLSMPPTSCGCAARRRYGPGSSAPASAAAVPACSRSPPTARQPSPSTGPVACPGRCRSSTSQTAASPGSTPSSTPTASSPSSACPPGSTPRTPGGSTTSSPVSASSSRSRADAPRSPTRIPHRPAVSRSLASASTAARSGSVSALTSHTTTVPRGRARSRASSRAVSAGASEGPTASTIMST